MKTDIHVVIISLTFLLRIRNVSGSVEKIKTHILWLVTFFKKNRAVHEKM